MPFIVSLLAHPERRRPSPPPPRTDLTRVVLVGMLAWGVALAVTLVLVATGTRGTWLDVLTCGAGLLLGVLGLLWARRHREDPSEESSEDISDGATVAVPPEPAPPTARPSVPESAPRPDADR